jgi:hypothetical protein
VVFVGMVVALGRTPAQRVLFYSQLRQHRLPRRVSQVLATYWPERLLSATLKAAKRYDRSADQAKKQAAKILHMPSRRHLTARRVA